MKLIHLSGLERYLKTSKNSNIILSWNLNNDYFKHFKKKEIFYVSKVWQKNKFKVKNKVIKLRKKILPQLKKQLNLINKINYSKKEWEILLEPWLFIYLYSMYFRWIVINELISKYKNFRYFEIKNKKNIPFFDTLQYAKLMNNDDVCNHLLLQDILKFKKITKGKIKTNYNFTIQKKKLISKIFTQIKNSPLFILYEKIICKIFNIKILVNLRTKKINFLKLCFKLNVIPFKGLSIFSRDKLINISNRNDFNKIKRFKLKIEMKKKDNFEKYIINRIQNDIPRVYIENFFDIKKIHANQLSKTNIVVTDTMHVYNPIFKSWLAYKKNLNKKFKIITSDHGGIYGGQQIYNYNLAISTIDFKNQKNINKKQLSLPCLFLNKHKCKFKNKILLVCKDITKYPRAFRGPICDEINYEINQIKKVIKCIDNSLKDKIFIRPYLVENGWRPHKEYKKIIGVEKIAYSNNLYSKLKEEAYIKIVTYPQTAFLECLINGPTFLLFDPKYYNDSKQNKKYMKILFKNKIAFKSGKQLAIHLNQIEKNILSWWQQKKIQNSVNLFINKTSIYNDDPTSDWAKNLKKIIS